MEDRTADRNQGPGAEIVEQATGGRLKQLAQLLARQAASDLAASAPGPGDASITSHHQVGDKQ